MSYLVTPRYPNSILPMGGGVLPKHIEVRDPGHSQHWVCLISRVHGSIPSPDLVISGSGISDPLVGSIDPDLGIWILGSSCLWSWWSTCLRTCPRIPMCVWLRTYCTMRTVVHVWTMRMDVHTSICSSGLVISGSGDLRESGPTMASRDRSRPWIWILAPCVYVSTHAVLCLAWARPVPVHAYVNVVTRSPRPTIGVVCALGSMDPSHLRIW